MSEPAPSRSRRGPDGSREAELLGAARVVFKREGYDGATVAQIVREAGVAQGTFYLYFSSKKEAFFALGMQLFEEMASHVAAALQAESTIEERVRVITHSCFAAARENADLVRLVFFGADSASAELQERFARGNPVVSALTAMLERDIEEGRIEGLDPELTARLLMGLVKNAVLEAFVLGNERDAKRLEEATADLFANAISGGGKA